jgi:hypothetical protein
MLFHQKDKREKYQIDLIYISPEGFLLKDILMIYFFNCFD